MSMTDYIPLSMLNDFIFCPYSIYLHSVYMEVAEDVYKASPQTKGIIAHQGIDNKNGSTRKSDILALPVYSDELEISGIIDILKQDKHLLVERKYVIRQIYRGQLYQLWGQFFCLREMGYDVRQLAFYEMSSNKNRFIEIPTEVDKLELKEVINRFLIYDPGSTQFTVNPNKCAHCIYCNLCDKTTLDNVYT